MLPLPPPRSLRLCVSPSIPRPTACQLQLILGQDPKLMLQLDYLDSPATEPMVALPSTPPQPHAAPSRSSTPPPSPEREERLMLQREVMDQTALIQVGGRRQGHPAQRRHAPNDCTGPGVHSPLWRSPAACAH